MRALRARRAREPRACPALLTALLLAYPPAFRAAFGREIALCARDGRRALGNAGRAAAAHYWVVVAADVLWSASAERMDALRSTPARLQRRRALGSLLVAGASFNVGYDAARAELSMGGLALLVTALSALVGTVLLTTRIRSAGAAAVESAA